MSFLPDEVVATVGDVVPRPFMSFAQNRKGRASLCYYA